MSIETIYKTFFTEYPDMLEVHHVCEILGNVNRVTIYNLIKENQLPAKKIGKKYLVSKLNLIQFLELI